jgi:hypothetical protein
MFERHVVRVSALLLSAGITSMVLTGLDSQARSSSGAGASAQGWLAQPGHLPQGCPAVPEPTSPRS